MLVSTKGRYALRVMIDLAEHEGDGYLPLRDVAARQAISDYTVGEVLRATEGKLAAVSGMDDLEQFRAEEPRCHEMWERLGAIVEDYLDGIRVSDLCVTSLAGNDYVI